MARLLVTWLMLMTLGTAGAAQEPGRIALLISNQRYNDNVGPLKNPANDAALVGIALREVGFEIAKSVSDGTREDMLSGTYDLARRLRQSGRGAVGFFYYTGHGVSVGSDNVLVPTNAESTTDEALGIRGVRLSEILDILQRTAPDAVLFVVLDACRNNIRGQRGAKGFVPVGDQRTGVVIAFATAAGQTASDEGASSGPYAAALAAELVKPGVTDQAVFNAVRARVVESTRRQQTPWTHDGLIGDRVVFKTVSRIQQSDSSGAAEIVRICGEIAAITSQATLTVLEKRHTGTPIADCISARLGELRTAVAAATVPSQGSSPDEPLRDFTRLSNTEVTGRSRVYAGERPNAQACSSRCLAEPSCEAFSFNSENKFCYLIDGITAREPRPMFVSGILLPGAASRRPHDGQDRHMDNVELIGSSRTFAGALESAEQCSTRCRATASCEAFSYNKLSRYCFLVEGNISQRGDGAFISARMR